jgi:hypothetical protein
VLIGVFSFTKIAGLRYSHHRCFPSRRRRHDRNPPTSEQAHDIAVIIDPPVLRRQMTLLLS